MDRLRHLTILFLATVACDDPKQTTEPRPSRFQAVQTADSSKKAAESFCEKTFPLSEGRRWSDPPSRAMPKKAEIETTPKIPQGAGWTWVNLWASWCGPCIKELPLLSKWRDTLAKEGLFVRYEMWSIDATEQELNSALDRSFPGEVKWLRSEDDLPLLLESIGVDKGSAIPVHALVDPKGNLRCVRVGSIGEEAYGQVKAILAGG